MELWPISIRAAKLIVDELHRYRERPLSRATTRRDVGVSTT